MVTPPNNIRLNKAYIRELILVVIKIVEIVNPPANILISKNATHKLGLHLDAYS